MILFIPSGKIIMKLFIIHLKVNALRINKCLLKYKHILSL